MSFESREYHFLDTLRKSPPEAIDLVCRTIRIRIDYGYLTDEAHSLLVAFAAYLVEARGVAVRIKGGDSPDLWPTPRVYQPLAKEEERQMLPENWMNLFDERQQKEIRFSQEYAANYAHGTEGHNAKLIIAKLAALLDEHYLTTPPHGSPIRPRRMVPTNQEKEA